MFHLMMLFAPILFWIFAAGLLALLLTGVGLVIAALAGGTSAALLVRNKMARRLLLCGCGFLLFSGLACIVLVLDLPFWVSVACCAAAAVLAVLGLCGCGGIAAKAARAAVTVLFALALASALVLGCIIAAIGI